MTAAYLATRLRDRCSCTRWFQPLPGGLHQEYRTYLATGQTLEPRAFPGQAGACRVAHQEMPQASAQPSPAR